MTSLTVDDGVRLELTQHGNPAGRPVVLLAGFRGAGSTWSHQVGSLVRAGYRVIVVDLRGHGASERPESGVDMARRGQDLHQVIRTLDLTAAVLIGASMGGNTIWSLLDQFGATHVSAIVIVDQTPKMLNAPDWPYGRYGYVEANVDTYFAEGIPGTRESTPFAERGMRLLRPSPRKPSAGEAALAPGELALVQDHARRDWRPTLARTEVPILFVAGAKSNLWPSSHARAAAALAPRGQAAVIRNAAHQVNIEQPAAFNRGVLAFMRRVAPAHL